MKTLVPVLLSAAILFSAGPVTAISNLNSNTAKTTENCVKAARLSEEANKVSESAPAFAVNKLREAAAYCPSSASLQYNLAMIQYQQGTYKEAEEALRAALAINENYAKALNALAFLMYAQSGDARKALPLALKATELEPANTAFRNTLDLISENIDTPPLLKTKRPNAIAVVIGNKNYSNPLLPAVKYADRDALVIKKYLIITLGFDDTNVILLNDATHLDFAKYFGDAADHKGILYKRVKNNVSDIFVFYSGHGAPDTNTRKAYLMPIDADPSVIKLTGYSLDLLYDNLARLNKEKSPRSISVVLDACFSGGSNEGMFIQNASPIYIETSTPILAMRNAVVLTSSKGSQISSWYPARNHGLFTYYFLKAVKTAALEGKKLSASDIEKVLNDADGVNDRAWKLYNREQEPQVLGNKNILLLQ